MWLHQEPFAFWQDRDLYRNVEDLSVREEDINNAIYMNDKDPCRVTTLMNKVMRGKPIKMIVIGGSNSAGGGITDHRRLFHRLFSQWWSQVILPNTGSKLTVENLSLGGTGSDFFTFCLQNFISKNDEPDIVLIELSVNDYGYLHGKTTWPMELLTRRLLSLSSFPLVFYVSLVDLVKKSASYSSIKNPRCHNLEDLGQRELASYYGIPLLSWRDILCPLNPVNGIRKPYIRPGMVNKDHLHIDVKGHAQVALMIIRYFQNVSQKAFQKVPRRGVCCPWNRGAGILVSTEKITPLFVNFSIQTLSSYPLCWSLISTNFQMSDGSQSLKVKVLIRKGFRKLVPESKWAKMKYSYLACLFGGADRNDSFGGWRSRKGGSFIVFTFTAPKIAGKSEKWSVGLVLRGVRNGSIRVWLDENERNAVTITGKIYGRVLMQTRIFFLETMISSGTHKMQLNTEKLREGFDVLLSGIVLGPPGMRDIKEYKPTNTLEKVWSYEDYKKLLIDSNKQI